MDLRIMAEPQEGATYAQQLAVARLAEEHGFDGFFRSDHVSRIHPGDRGPGPTDSWVTLGALARETERIRLGTMVGSATFRLPGMLAIAAAQVDAMSGGRVEVGLGAGWYDTEHVQHGIPFPPDTERFARLEEQLQILHGFWSTPDGETFTHLGTHYQLLDCPALPKAHQPGGPPVIVGGVGPVRTPRLAARYAAEYNQPFVPVAFYTEQVARSVAACEAIGRDPDDLIQSVCLTVCCAESDDELGRRAGMIGRSVDELRENHLAGSPADVLERLADYAEAGARRVYLQVLDLEDVDHVHLLGEQVLPVLP
jgi:F420-dependent oxidoreductase-like protein